MNKSNKKYLIIFFVGLNLFSDLFSNKVTKQQRRAEKVAHIANDIRIFSRAICHSVGTAAILSKNNNMPFAEKIWNKSENDLDSSLSTLIKIFVWNLVVDVGFSFVPQFRVQMESCNTKANCNSTAATLT